MQAADRDGDAGQRERRQRTGAGVALGLDQRGVPTAERVEVTEHHDAGADDARSAARRRTRRCGTTPIDASRSSAGRKRSRRPPPSTRATPARRTSGRASSSRSAARATESTSAALASPTGTGTVPVVPHARQRSSPRRVPWRVAASGRIGHNGAVTGGAVTAGKRAGSRRGPRPKRSLPARSCSLLALGITLSVVAWGYLVYAAIDFGSTARGGDSRPGGSWRSPRSARSPASSSG